MRRRGAAVLAAALAATGPASADEPRFVPTGALVASGQSETMTVDVGGARTEERRSDVRFNPALGLGHRFTAPKAVSLDGHASVGLGPNAGAGRYQLPVREDVGVAWRAWSWLTLRGGLGAGLTLDLGRSSGSYADLALPVSATFFDVVELVYRPYLSLPVAREDRATFGGTRELSASTALVPLDFALRFRAPVLGF